MEKRETIQVLLQYHTNHVILPKQDCLYMSKSYIPDTLNQLTIETGGMKRKCKYHRNLWLNQEISTTALTQLCSQLRNHNRDFIKHGGN
ncbi:hypothetical protein COI87_10260 [Bacillus thuringiensis]|nr:hypothetical protein COI87_10260 [Bacillus thuringiensis]PGX85031.1 hypothetical protein COE45_06420 [Bacillus thuringiensis]